VKIEKRGKYPGVKVHLEPDECQVFMALAEDIELCSVGTHESDAMDYFTIALKIGRKMRKAAKEHPDLLLERTPEQIEAALLSDKEKIEKQLAAGVTTSAWKHVE
jgi:hypothetical protein